MPHAAPRENSVTARENGEVAPSTPWQHFGEGRGEARSAGFPARSDGATSAAGSREGEGSAPSEGGREEGAPSDSWGRFSTSRAESYESTRNPYADREAGREDQTPSDPWGRFSASRGESYGSTRNAYQTERNPYGERGSYAIGTRAVRIHRTRVARIHRTHAVRILVLARIVSIVLARIVSIVLARFVSIVLARFVPIVSARFLWVRSFVLAGLLGPIAPVRWQWWANWRWPATSLASIVVQRPSSFAAPQPTCRTRSHAMR